ncbi:MAG: MBOAT family O-acyltransferase [Bacillota bacterium]
MLFHTVQFFWFMLAVVTLVLILPRAATMPLLLAASYVFYGWSGLFFLLLLICSSTTDYALARIFAARRGRWKAGIVVSAIVNFSLLGFFKYANFALSNANEVLSAWGMNPKLPMLEIVLPVGISFYTFQSFAYTVDVLTGRIPPCRSYPRFLLFVSWFPQLVAGPINRAGALLPEIEKIPQRLDRMAQRVPAAAALFAEGWIRKACADLASPVSDAFFRDPSSATSATAIFGIVAFAVQIYGDFSGYTKMAQGASWLFGVRVVENFNLPYAASSVRDFWRRWHISLSSWFRDYLYIPLGGNRKGPARTYFNLAFTMLVCGFWHGANWTFLAWGAAHGTLLILERLFESPGRRVPRPLAHILTLAFVFLAWGLFRAPDLHTAGQAYAALLHGGWSLPPLQLVAATLALIAADAYFRFHSRREYAELSADQPVTSTRFEWRSAGLVAVCALLWTTAHFLGQNKVTAFIYFQF